MNGNGWRHFAMLFAGFGLIFAGVFIGSVATEYEYAHQKSAADAQGVSDAIGTYGVTEYGALSAEDRRLVDDLVDGRELRVETNDEIIMRWGSGFVVSTEDQYHVVTRRTVVDWSDPAALGGLAAGLVGLGLIPEAIRRHHFPHYRPFAGAR